MGKLKSFPLIAAFAFISTNAVSGELEGALQYPSVGRRGCATPATGQNAPATRITMADRNGVSAGRVSRPTRNDFFPTPDPLR
jgi:hypothetical protein